MINQAGGHSHDTNSNIGHVEVNGFRATLSREFRSYKADLMTGIYVWQVSNVANDFNVTNPLTFESAQIRGLKTKIKKHPYLLVRF